MIREISPIELGGSLYVPATHKNVDAICNQNKFPNLRSCIIDTEDAINKDDLELGLENISKMLEHYTPHDLKVFIRPRDPKTLEKILTIRHIEKIDGFSLPKFSTEVMKEYKIPSNFHIMPVLESQDIFSSSKLESIRDYLLNLPNVLMLRIGGEDMMNYLGLKRKCDESIYDLVGPAQVIGNIINTFKPYGFSISATVFNCIDHLVEFSNNVKDDLRQGLIGKTIIHPSQIDPINELYKVSTEEVHMAEKMLDETTDAIIVHQGAMGEKFAHTRWAKNILERKRFYGISDI